MASNITSKKYFEIVEIMSSRTCLSSRLRGMRDPETRNVKSYYVYILASERNGTLYIGVTDDLVRRVSEHKNQAVEGFTKKYHVHTLVYFEETSDIRDAIQREKQLKKWRRQWKLTLIEKDNPIWRDLYDDLR